MKRFRIQIEYGNKPGTWDEYFESSDTQAGAQALLEKAQSRYPNSFRIFEYDTGDNDETIN